MQNPPQKRLKNVAETSLVLVYIRAFETQSKSPIIYDPNAVEMLKHIEFDVNKLKKLVNKSDIIFSAMRVRRFDQYVDEFLQKTPDGIVVSLGCGLDDRFHRIDNGKVTFYDLDLPEVIRLRKELIQESPRNHFIAQSVIDFQWLDSLKDYTQKRILFLAEGLLMYLQELDIKNLILNIQQKFPGSEIIFDVFSKFALKIKQRHSVIKEAQASLQWAIDSNNALESWGKGITLIDSWNYFDQPEKKLGFMRLNKIIPVFRNISRIVHYRIE
jgi:methyltransferase (TIGR00027 family)